MKCNCGSTENVKKTKEGAICCSCFLAKGLSWADWHAIKGSQKIDPEQLARMKEFIKNPPKKVKKKTEKKR